MINSEYTLQQLFDLCESLMAAINMKGKHLIYLLILIEESCYSSPTTKYYCTYYLLVHLYYI